MASLYQIREDIDRILETGLVVDPETGEISNDDAAAKLSELQLGEKEKLENVALYIKNLAADVDAIKAEENALADRRRPKEKKIASLRDYLAGFMEFTNRKKLETARCALSFRASKSLAVTDEAAVREYAKINNDILRYKEPELNKKLITDLIKSGVVIAGAELTDKVNLQIK